MKPAPFDYVRADSLAEVHDVLAAEGSDAAVLAGGQSLVPLLSMRMARPEVLVDIMHVAELGGIAIEDGAIRVGATVWQADGERSQDSQHSPDSVSYVGDRHDVGQGRDNTEKEPYDEELDGLPINYVAKPLVPFGEYPK